MKELVFTQAETGAIRQDVQLTILTEDGWCVYGPYWRKSGLYKFAHTPAFPPGTPVVFLDQEQAQRAETHLRRHISPAGVDNVDALVQLLVGLGGAAIY